MIILLGKLCNSLTWTKAIKGNDWMISLMNHDSQLQWGRYNLPRLVEQTRSPLSLGFVSSLTSAVCGLHIAWQLTMWVRWIEVRIMLFCWFWNHYPKVFMVQFILISLSGAYKNLCCWFLTQLLVISSQVPYFGESVSCLYCMAIVG